MTDKRTRKTLLEQLRDRHDERSWEEFVQYYRPYVYGIVRSQEVPRDDCEDIVQDVLLKTWNALPTYAYEEGRSRFRSWLAVVTRNTILDFWKSKATRQRRSQESLDASVDLAVDPEMLEIVDREWKKHLSQLAWQRVEPSFSGEVIEVFWALSKGNSTAEVAARFNVKPNTAIVYRRRVEKALMKEIIRLEDELG